MYTDYPVSKILRQLDRDNLLPAIIFRSARKQCDQDLTQLTKKSYLQIKPEHQKDIENRIAELVLQYSWDFEILKNHEQYKTLIHFAAGAHHAGQLLTWRLMLEELMTSGLLRMLIATGTVAAGVDFPARTVVVTAHSKRGHLGFNTLASSEFQQMSGRAGRRGKDSVGFCLVAPNPYADARVISEIDKSPPEPLRSAYFASPSSILNLLKYRSIEDLKFIVKNSLGGFVDQTEALKIIEEADKEELKLAGIPENDANFKRIVKKVRRLKRNAEELVNKQMTELEITLQALKNLGHVNATGGLTEKGTWTAELCTSIVLELSEFIEDFLLNDCSTLELVGIVASISGDAHRSYLRIKNTVVKKDKLEALASKVQLVKDMYQVKNFERGIEVLPDAASTVETWVQASSWGEFSALLKLSGVTEGDAARLITQTADHLQQISRLGTTHFELAQQAKEARDLLLRPPLSEVII